MVGQGNQEDNVCEQQALHREGGACHLQTGCRQLSRGARAGREAISAAKRGWASMTCSSAF